MFIPPWQAFGVIYLWLSGLTVLALKHFCAHLYKLLAKQYSSHTFIPEFKIFKWAPFLISSLSGDETARFWIWQDKALVDSLSAKQSGNIHDGIFILCRWALPIYSLGILLFSDFWLEVSGLSAGNQHITNSYVLTPEASWRDATQVTNPRGFPE